MNKWDEKREVQRALELISETIILLERNTSGGASNYLQSYLKKIKCETPFVRKEAFKKIQIMCHPKAFGDLFVQGLDWDEWWDHVEKVGKACEEAFIVLDKEKLL
jgi:hypothetical protein